jgi:hypothetical protein
VTVQNLVDGRVTDRERCAYLASLFRGSALTWLTRQLDTNTNILNDYEEFVAQVQQSFAVDETAVKLQASRALTRCTQKTSVQDYRNRFNPLADDSGINKEHKIATFIAGLKPEIRRALIIADTPSDYDKLVAKAIELDSNLYYAGGSKHGGGGKRGQPGNNKYPPKQPRDKKGHFVKAEY